MVGAFLLQNGRIFCTASVNAKQSDQEGFIGVKIAPDSVITRDGMRSEVLWTDFHFTSTAE